MYECNEWVYALCVDTYANWMISHVTYNVQAAYFLNILIAQR